MRPHITTLYDQFHSLSWSVCQNLGVYLCILHEAQLVRYFDEPGISLATVKLCVHLELSEADRAQSAIRDLIVLKGTIGAVHGAFIVNAVLQPKHMRNFVHHCATSASAPDQGSLLLRYWLLRSLGLDSMARK